MLGRRTSNRVTRRKSAASIPERSRNDPEISRRQAYVAATYAFARAQERSSADMGSNGTEARNTAIQPRNINMSSRPENEASGGVLKHQQSIRFAGPLAAPRPSLGTRTVQHNPVQEKRSTKSLQSPTVTNDAPIPLACRPSTSYSSFEKASSTQVGPDRYAFERDAYQEYFTNEDDIVTPPSSYRRIRRSKSLLHPGKVPGVLFNNGTGENLIMKQENNTLLRSRSNLALKTSKSMRNLPGGRPWPTQNPVYDVAVQTARDKFLYQVEQQRLREQPSFLFSSNKSRREEKLFRSSVRTNSSTNSYGMPVASRNQTPRRVWDSTLRRRAQHASKSFKSKLKGLFRRNNGDAGASIPNQEVQAQKSHITNYEIQIGPPTQPSNAYEQLHVPDSTTLSRVSSQLPPFRKVSSNQDLCSIAGSMQSVSSEASNTSKAIICTDTGMTTKSRYAAAERDQQRLSVINENSTHKTSSSFPRTPLKNQFTAYPAFHLPGNSHGHPPPPIGPVDSARVYSALMRRLDENSPNAKLIQQRESTKTSQTPKQESLRISPSDNGRNSQGYKPTIIEVQNSREILCASTNSSRNTPKSHDVFFTARSYTDSGSLGGISSRRSSSTSTIITRKPNYKAYPPPVMGDLSTKMISRKAPMGSEFHGLVSKGPRETRSTFFGGSELTNIGATPSPYRRAMAEAELTSAMGNMNMYTDSSPFMPDRLRRSALSQLDSVLDKHITDKTDGGYTESIYSRTTSGRTPPKPIEQTLVSKTLTPRKLGSVLLAETPTYRLPVPSSQVNTSAESTDWKVQMSAQVPKLEKTKEATSAALSAVNVVPHVLPTIPRTFWGHVRESAEISGDDLVVLEPNVTGMSDQSLRVREQSDNILPQPILKYKISSTSLLVPSLPSASSQRVRHSLLRQVPSKTSMRSMNSVLNERVVSNTAANVIVNLAENATYSQSERAKTLPTLVRRQSSATLRDTQAPSKFIKLNGNPGSNANAETPGPEAHLVEAAEKQFGSVGERMSKIENCVPARTKDAGGTESVMVNWRAAEADGQAMGTRRMVDLFLSSRRRRVAGSEDSNVFL